MITTDETIIKKYTKAKTIFEAQVELTNRCNLDCVHCLRDRSVDNELTTKEIKKILDALDDMRCNRLLLSGGEPLLREDVFEIIRYGIKKNFIIFLFTNGINLTLENIKYFSHSNLLNIQISLYGISPKTHDSITQMRGSFEKTMQAIHLLKRYNIHFLVVVMVMNVNFHEIEALQRKASAEGWEILFDFVINPRFDGSRKPLKYRLTDEQLKETARMGLLQETYASDRSKGCKFFEIIARSYVCISSKGKVFPFITIREEAGDLRKHNFADIWKKSEVLDKFRSLKNQSFECWGCRYFNVCPGNPGLAELEEKNLFKRPKEMCRIIRCMKENS